MNNNSSNYATAFEISFFCFVLGHNNVNETLKNNNSSNYATSFEISFFCFILGHNNVNETLMNNNSSNYATAFEASLHQNGSGGGGAGDTSTTSQFSTPNFPVMSKIFPQHNLPETSSMTTSTSIPTTTSTDLTRIGKQNICKNTRISR